jgi:cyclopropane fatty-acyl-phospholipid synthase-like methyltransferase
VNWREFWNVYPLKANGNLFAQVGRTVGGIPIPESHLRASVEDILRNLEVQSEDTILDLCCGNGLLTREIGRHCRQVVGIDFSEPLIKEAKRRSALSNVEYRLGDILLLNQLAVEFANRFDKVLMSDAMGSFDEVTLPHLLPSLKCLCKDNAPILLTGVPDDGRKWRFYDNWRRRWTYLYRIKLLRRDPGVGKWWSRNRLQTLCAKAGLRCEFRDQNAMLHSAHYRMDVLLIPAKAAAKRTSVPS